MEDTPLSTNQPPEQGKTIGQVKDAAAPKPPLIKKKTLILCLSIFGAIILILFALAFVFVAKATEEEGMVARLLGISQASFVNGSITLIHIIFILVALIPFVFTMLGLFKMLTAKKEDNEKKKSGLKASIFSGAILLVILISWIFAYVYLDGRRVFLKLNITDPILTEPASTINLTAPIEIKFDSSHAPVNKSKFQIIYYEWDFGDEQTGTGQITSHKYEQRGKYDVILTITKKDKTTSEEFKDQYSEVVSITNQALTASFTAEPQSGEAPLKVDFDASSSVDPDGTISRYEWDLDDDEEFEDGEGVKITHTFDRIGRYKVSLRVTSTIGEFNIAEKEIIVEEKKNPEAVIAILDEPEIFLAGISYVFKAEESKSPNGKIEKYEWNFSDSSKKETTKTVSHVFKNEGTYEVVLKVIDEKDKEGQITKTITVGMPKGRPEAKFTTDPLIADKASKLEGKAPFIVGFDASATTDSDGNIVDYEWDFDNDGTIDGYGKIVSHTYQLEGTYTANLKVTDADDNTDTETLLINVLPEGINVVLNADKIEGIAPLTVNFDASGSTYNKGQITSYKWDFGDGTAPKLGSAKITHKYTTVGTYTAVVTVIGADNSSAAAQIFITIRETPLTACFTSVFEEGPAPLQTSFDPACSTGTIISYFWDFGDNGTATEAKPSHTFLNAGTYTVKLEINDADKNVSKAQLVIKVKQQ